MEFLANVVPLVYKWRDKFVFCSAGASSIMAANTANKSAQSYKAMCLYQNSRYRRLSDNRSSIRVGSAWARCGEQLTIGHGPLEHRRLIDSYVIVVHGLRRFIRCFCFGLPENVLLFFYLYYEENVDEIRERVYLK